MTYITCLILKEDNVAEQWLCGVYFIVDKNQCILWRITLNQTFNNIYDTYIIHLTLTINQTAHRSFKALNYIYWYVTYAHQYTYGFFCLSFICVGLVLLKSKFSNRFFKQYVVLVKILIFFLFKKKKPVEIEYYGYYKH